MDELLTAASNSDAGGGGRASPLSSVASARGWLMTFRRKTPKEQRRELMNLLQSAVAGGKTSPELLDSIITIDVAWYAIEAEFARHYRRNPSAVTLDVAGFQREMGNVNLAFVEAYSPFILAMSPTAAEPGFQDDAWLQVIALSLYHLSKHAKWSFCNSEPYEAQAWRRLHDLYILATGADMAGEPLALFPNEENITTCNQLWLRTVLLASLNAGNLAPRQIDKAEEWLESWCKGITTDNSYDESKHIYAVDIFQPAGSQRITPETKLATPIYLRTTNLYSDIVQTRMQVIEEAMSSSIGWHASNPLPEYIELLDRLKQMWASAPAGKSQRFNARSGELANRKIDVLRGFTEIVSVHVDPGKQSRALESWVIRDLSESGFGLLAPIDERLAPGVGDLVCARRQDAGRWQIGVVVRAMVLPEDQACFVGVHILSQVAIPVMLTEDRPIPERAQDPRISVDWAVTLPPRPRRALYLVGEERKKQRDSLLSAAKVFALDERLVLKTAHNEFIIRISRVIQSGPDWRRTGFEVLRDRLRNAEK